MKDDSPESKGAALPPRAWHVAQEALRAFVSVRIVAPTLESKLSANFQQYFQFPGKRDLELLRVAELPLCSSHGTPVAGWSWGARN